VRRPRIYSLTLAIIDSAFVEQNFARCSDQHTVTLNPASNPPSRHRETPTPTMSKPFIGPCDRDADKRTGLEFLGGLLNNNSNTPWQVVQGSVILPEHFFLQRQAATPRD